MGQRTKNHTEKRLRVPLYDERYTAVSPRAALLSNLINSRLNLLHDHAKRAEIPISAQRSLFFLPFQIGQGNVSKKDKRRCHLHQCLQRKVIPNFMITQPKDTGYSPVLHTGFQSGFCPSCANHLHSVSSILVNTALKEEFSGLQA